MATEAGQPRARATSKRAALVDRARLFAASDPRDNVYTLRRRAVALRSAGDELHEQARELEQTAWQLWQSVQRPT